MPQSSTVISLESIRGWMGICFHSNINYLQGFSCFRGCDIFWRIISWSDRMEFSQQPTEACVFVHGRNTTSKKHCCCLVLCRMSSVPRESWFWSTPECESLFCGNSWKMGWGSLTHRSVLPAPRRTNSRQKNELQTDVSTTRSSEGFRILQNQKIKHPHIMGL